MAAHADQIAAHQVHAQLHAPTHVQAARAHVQPLAIIHAQALVHARQSCAHLIHANQHHAMYLGLINGTLVRM